MTDERLARAFARIDSLNAEDPASEVVDGAKVPKALLYGRRMSAMLDSLDPEASDALRIAVRGQHVARFRRPRSSEPEGRVGYLTWRKKLAEMHADLCGEAARDAGYDAATIERVRFIVQKKALRTDAESQMLEDCACLVFLVHEFADFAAQHDDAKVVDILGKTWPKMSERGHEVALRTALGAREAALVAKALGSGS